MQRALICTLMGLILLPPVASAVPVLNAGNGHYYEFVVSDDITWETAREEADGLVFLGLQGLYVVR
jgi:hypothetical protein